MKDVIKKSTPVLNDKRAYENCIRYFTNKYTRDGRNDTSFSYNYLLQNGSVGTGSFVYGVKQNIVQSVINSLISKMSLYQNSIFLLPNNADPRIALEIPKCQKDLNSLLKYNDSYTEMLLAFRDSLLVGTGCCQIHNDGVVKQVPIDQIYLIENDVYNKNISVVVKKRKLTAYQIKDELKEKGKFRLDFDASSYDAIDVVECWDLNEQKYCYHIEQAEFYFVEKYEKELPFVFINWIDSFYGIASYGVIDQLSTIQNEIDLIWSKVRSGLVAFGNAFAIGKHEFLNENKVSNQPFNIYMVPSEAEGNHDSVQNSYQIFAPDYINRIVFDELDRLVAAGYDVVGLNTQAVSGQIPASISSGVAQRQYLVQADQRFNKNLQDFQVFGVSIANKILKTTDKEAIKKKHGNLINFSRILKYVDNFQVEVFPVPKDATTPAEKIQQIDEMRQQGLIKDEIYNKVRSYPDLMALNNMNNSVIDYMNAYIGKYYDDPDCDLQLDEAFPMMECFQYFLYQYLSLVASSLALDLYKEEVKSVQKIYQMFENVRKRMNPEVVNEQ